MYRVIVASHRSNVRDTVLHLVIINPVAARNTAVRNLDSDRALYSAGSIIDENIEFTTGEIRISPLRWNRLVFQDGDLQDTIRLYYDTKCICLLTILRPTCR